MPGTGQGHQSVGAGHQRPLSVSVLRLPRIQGTRREEDTSGDFQTCTWEELDCGPLSQLRDEAPHVRVIEGQHCCPSLPSACFKSSAGTLVLLIEAVWFPGIKERNGPRKYCLLSNQH